MNAPPRERLDVTVIHETDGRKYLEALVQLQREGSIGSLEFVEASVCWKFAHSLIRERKPVRASLMQAFRNLRFRAELSKIRGRTIVLCVPPWDFRFLPYARLRQSNRLIYNTSWPNWDSHRVPRKWGPLTPIVRARWLRVLREPDVDIVAVTAEAADGLSRYVSRPEPPTVISHAVSAVFFNAPSARHSVPFRLLFVGELVERRGIRELPALLSALSGQPVELVIIGDGPLRNVASLLVREYGATWHGHISDREELARIVSSCHVMVSMAIRSDRWEELFGMSILEAMACGVPCIASDHIGPRSFIRSGTNGLLVSESGSVRAADWITLLIRDADAWRAVSIAASESAAAFTLGSVSNRWATLLLGCRDMSIAEGIPLIEDRPEST